MANVVITIYDGASGVLEARIGEFATGDVITSSNPVEVLAGDTVTFKVNYGGASGYITLSEFASTHWTNTSNDMTYFNSYLDLDYFTKTIKSPPTSYSTDTISMTATGKSGYVYVKTVTAIDTTPDLAGVLGYDKYNGTSDVAEVINFTLTGITTGQNITITSSATQTSGYGATCTMSVNNMNGTYTNSVTATLGDLIWVRMYSGVTQATSVTYTISSNGASDTRIYKTGEGYGDGDIIQATTSGAISASNFMWLFGCHQEFYSVAPTKANSLSDYYQGGSFVPNETANSNVPTSGAISFSNLYSAISKYYIQVPIQDRLLNTSTTSTQTHTINFKYSDYTAGYGQQKYCSDIRISAAIIPVSVGCYDSSQNYVGDENDCLEILPTTDNDFHGLEGVDVTFKVKGTNWKSLYGTFFMTIQYRNIVDNDGIASFPLCKLLLTLDNTSY